MKYQIVLQWAAASISDYDRMIEVESMLIDNLSEDCEVDVTMLARVRRTSLFIRTMFATHSTRLRVYWLVHLRSKVCASAYREIGENEYTALWPDDLVGFSVA